MQYAGEALGSGKGHRTSPYRAARPWAAFAKKHPLLAAEYLFRCFESFTEAGYFMEDFGPDQFTFLAPESHKRPEAGGVFLVDGPLYAPGAARTRSKPPRFHPWWPDHRCAAGSRPCAGPAAAPARATRSSTRAPFPTTRLRGASSAASRGRLGGPAALVWIIPPSEPTDRFCHI